MSYENNEGVAIIVYLCTMMIITEDQSVVIINLWKLFKEIDGGLGEVGIIVGRLGWLFLIVISFVLMLCDLYAILEKSTVYVIDKMSVGVYFLCS